MYKYRGVLLTTKGLTAEDVETLSSYNRFEFVRDSINFNDRKSLPNNEVLAVFEFYCNNRDLFNFTKIGGKLQ